MNLSMSLAMSSWPPEAQVTAEMFLCWLWPPHSGSCNCFLDSLFVHYHFNSIVKLETLA